MKLSQQAVHRIFRYSVLLKGMNAVWELFGGITLAFVSPSTLSHWFTRYSRAELIEDPHDPLINFLSVQLQHLSVSGKIFGAVFILVHGIVNFTVVIGLLRERLWAFRAGIGLSIIFLLYQFFRLAHSHSLFLLGLSLFDLFALWLIWHQYRYHREHGFSTRKNEVI